MADIPEEPWECFDSPRDWQLYQESRKAPYPCYDCSAYYQRLMKMQGRCRHPETVFIQACVEGDIQEVGICGNNRGYNFGTRPSAQDQARATRGETDG